MNEISRIAFETAARDAAWLVLPVILADCGTGEIVSLTKYAADIFGYEVHELMHKPIELLIPGDVQDAHARWRQDANVPKTRLMGVGRQIRGMRKNGTTFPAHVGLTTITALDRLIGIAFVIDLTGVVQ